MQDTELNYVASLIIESFKENGLDDAYLEDKIVQFSHHDSKYQSLSWACTYLDDRNTAVFAQKLGVDPSDLDIVRNVFKQI